MTVSHFSFCFDSRCTLASPSYHAPPYEFISPAGDNGPNQQWYITYNKELKTRHDFDMCLTEDGVDVRMQSCNGEEKQKFGFAEGLLPVDDVITAVNDKCLGMDTDTGKAYLQQCRHGE